MEWDQYVNLISHGATKLIAKEDKLSWSENLGIGEYTTKLRYAARVEVDVQEEWAWW